MPVKEPGGIPTTGLLVGRSGMSLETVSSKSGEVALLFSGRGMEVTHGALQRGRRLTLVPADDDESSEMYYILEGVLHCEHPHGHDAFGPGDHLAVTALAETVILTAYTDVRFLYLSTRPAFHQISRGLNQLRRLAVEVELKDGYTAEHCERLQTLSYATGRELGLEADRLHALDYGAYLHDVGKIRIPLEILLKPAALSEEEWNIIKQHPVHGQELLEATFMKQAAPIVAQHHERLDGSGYPHGIAGNEILVEAYIVAVADVYDAMTSDRPYRKALPARHAVEEIRRFTGTHYPREVVKAFESALKQCERENRIGAHV